MTQVALTKRWAINVTITAGAIVAASTVATGNVSAAWDDTAKTLTLTLAGGGIAVADAIVKCMPRGVAAAVATDYVPCLSNASTATSYVFEILNLAATPALATPNGIAVEITPVRDV